MELRSSWVQGSRSWYHRKLLRYLLNDRLAFAYARYPVI